MGSVTQNYLTKAETGTTITNLVNSQIFDNGTNVGVGTALPQSILDVITPSNGYSSFSRQLSIDAWTGIHFGYREDNSLYRKSALVFERKDGAARGKIHLLNNNGNDSTSATLADARLTIQSDGNVGIGTTSPAFRLDTQTAGSIITGTATIGSNMQGLRIYNTTTATTNNAIGLWFSTGPHQAGIASFRATADTTWETTLAFYTHVDTTSNLNDATEKMRITGNGNVGIGTTSPDTALHVNGILTLKSSTEGGPHIYRDNSNAADIRFYSTNGTFASPTAKVAEGLLGQIHYHGYTGTAYKVAAQIWAIVDGSVTSTVVPGRIEFKTSNDANNPATRMTIKSDGNVGIGTTNPSDKLEVRGVDNGITISSAVTDRPQLNLVNGSTNILRLSGNATYGAIGDGTSSDRYMIFRGGNIGIGTANPGVKLHVVGDIGGGSSYNGGFYADSGGGSVDTNWGFDFARTPATDDYSTRIKFFPTAGSTRKMGFYDERNDQWIAYADGSTNSSSNFIFNYTNNIGIGTTNPSYKLHVNGTMYSAGSSLEYKQDITYYDVVTDKLLQLQPVTYHYKPEYEHLGKKLQSDTQIGLIAEQVAEIFPELAVMKEEDGQWVVRNVDYEKLSILLLSEVQKLRKEVNQLHTSLPR